MAMTSANVQAYRDALADLWALAPAREETDEFVAANDRVIRCERRLSRWRAWLEWQRTWWGTSEASR